MAEEHNTNSGHQVVRINHHSTSATEDSIIFETNGMSDGQSAKLHETHDALVAKMKKVIKKMEALRPELDSLLKTCQLGVNQAIFLGPYIKLRKKVETLGEKASEIGDDLEEVLGIPIVKSFVEMKKGVDGLGKQLKTIEAVARIYPKDLDIAVGNASDRSDNGGKEDPEMEDEREHNADDEMSDNDDEAARDDDELFFGGLTEV